jgi:hypothetical protein
MVILMIEDKKSKMVNIIDIFKVFHQYYFSLMDIIDRR